MVVKPRVLMILAPQCQVVNTGDKEATHRGLTSGSCVLYLHAFADWDAVLRERHVLRYLTDGVARDASLNLNLCKRAPGGERNIVPVYAPETMSPQQCRNK